MSNSVEISRPAPAVGQRWALVSTWVTVEKLPNGRWQLRGDGDTAGETLTPGNAVEGSWFELASFLGYAPGFGPALETPREPMGVEVGQHRRWKAKGGRGFTVIGPDPQNELRMMIKFDDIGTHSYRIDDIAGDSFLEPVAAAAPATPVVVPPPSQHDFSDPYAVIVGRADGVKDIVRVCRHCGSEKDKGACKPTMWKSDDERMSAQLTETINREHAEKARPLFPASRPPAPFRQSHALLAGGVWSLRQEGGKR